MALLMAAQASGAGAHPQFAALRSLGLADLLALKSEPSTGKAAVMKPAGSARWAPTVAAATVPLADARLVAAAPPPDPSPEWVINRRRKDGLWLLHLAAYPLVGLPEDANMTHCTWRFGGLDGVVLSPVQPSAEEYKRVCKTCVPSIRRRLREDAVARAVSTAPEGQ